MKNQVYNKMLVTDDEVPWMDVDEGVKRKIMTYNENMMLVKVKFESGAVGALHYHPHLQMSYVAKGAFEVTMGANKKKLREGDVYFALPEIEHGVICLQPVILIDVFSPAREDFLI